MRLLVGLFEGTQGATYAWKTQNSNYFKCFLLFLVKKIPFLLNMVLILVMEVILRKTKDVCFIYM